MHCSAVRSRVSNGPTMCCSTTANSPGFCARGGGKGSDCNGSPWASASTCAMRCRRRLRVAPSRSRSGSRTCAGSMCSTGWCRRWSAARRSTRRSRSRSAPPSRRVTGCGAASSAPRRPVAPAGCVPTAPCSWTSGRGRSACARAMSSSLDLSGRARLALAVCLVSSAAGLPRLAVVRQLAGGTAVPLAAGVCALVALLAARLPLGFAWGPAGSQRAVPEVARGFAVGAACAAALIWQGNDALLARLWRDDRAASLALLAGVAAWGGAVATTRQRALLRWYGVAAAAALLPASLLIAVLRPTVPASGFAAAFVFFLVADTTVALVTEELAFRRALVGPPDSAGLGTLVLMALVFGLWHVVQPGYGGAPLGTLLGTALGGFVAGCVYTLSGSLTAAALYHGLHNAPLKALGGAPIATGRGGLASGVALAGTGALPVALGWMVWRRGGRASAGLSLPGHAPRHQRQPP